MAVELEQEGQWKVIHHFLWNGNSGFRGTEAVQINPAYQELNGGWTAQGELTGQVLYDKDGTSYTAEYASLQNEAYDTNQNFPFYGSQQYASIFAEFSMPHRGKTAADTWLTKSRQRKVTGGLIPGSITPIKRPSGSTQ